MDVCKRTYLCSPCLENARKKIQIIKAYNIEYLSETRDEMHSEFLKFLSVFYEWCKSWWERKQPNPDLLNYLGTQVQLENSLKDKRYSWEKLGCCKIEVLLAEDILLLFSRGKINMLLKSFISRRSTRGITVFTSRREKSVISSYEKSWRELVVKETKKAPEDLETFTPEGIVLKPLYTAADLPNEEECV